MSGHHNRFALAAGLVCCALLGICRRSVAAPGEYFAIHVVDDQTGRGVPLVELKTDNKIRYYTDSNGYVAFLEPGLMDRDVWFDVGSWGYEGPKGPFNYRGLALKTTPGGQAEVKVHRTQIAQRMYRLTGEGIYRDTVLLGRKAPIAEPVIDGSVMGQDTVETAIYNGKMFWFWGDTDRPGFPLGNFATTGATSELPDRLDPTVGINYTYFTDPSSGFARAMVDLKQKETLPIWIDGLMAVKDSSGHEHLLNRYTTTRNLAVVSQGLAQWNDQRQVFEPLKQFGLKTLLHPNGHPMRAVANNREYYYFPCPYPSVRVENNYEAATDPAAYEGYTCLKAGSSFAREHSQVDRDGEGHLVWAWRRGAEPLEPRQVEDLIKAGLIKREESPYAMSDADSGAAVTVAGGSVAYNAYRKKWTMLFGQLGGASYLGEIWYAEANAPEGPWRAAHKVATHARKDDNNDLYNPMQHPELSRDGGRFVFFEGTFVTTFSGNPFPTPRYNYNQLMYCIDLSDSRTQLPEPPPGASDTKPSTVGP